MGSPFSFDKLRKIFQILITKKKLKNFLSAEGGGKNPNSNPRVKNRIPQSNNELLKKYFEKFSKSRGGGVGQN